MAYTEWETPQDFFDTLDAEFHFTLDACASAINYKCKIYYAKGTSLLRESILYKWHFETVWMNPPHDRTMGEWVQRAYEFARQGGTIVCLLPGRSCDTVWWHDYVMKASEIRYIKNRLHFGKSGIFTRANISNVVVVFRPGCVGPPVVSSIDTTGNPYPKEELPF